MIVSAIKLTHLRKNDKMIEILGKKWNNLIRIIFDSMYYGYWVIKNDKHCSYFVFIICFRWFIAFSCQKTIRIGKAWQV